MDRYRVFQALTWFFALGLAVWILARLPLTTIRASLAGLSLAQWLLWTALNLAILVVYVQRWRCLLTATGVQIDFRSVFLLRQAGQLISFITPGPQFGGEPFQVYWLWKRFSASGAAALLGVALDRFYELWVNFAFLLLGLVVLMLTPALGLADWPALALGVALILFGLSCSGWFLVSQQARLSVWIKTLGRRWQHSPHLRRIEGGGDEFGARLRTLIQTEKGSLALALLLALLGWSGMIFEIWLLLRFFEIEADFTTLVLLLVGMRLAFLLPLPGGIGTLEAVMFWAFAALGLPMAGAAAVLAMIRLRDALILCVGLFALLRLRHICPPEDGPVGGKKRARS
ncbi:MAG: lysylphosphatidylglycerol synthase transmembrane domain-containing protein [Desulfuromonas sp.]